MDCLTPGRCVEAGPNSGRIMAAGVGVKVPADCVVVCRDSDGVVIALNRDNIERVTDLRNVEVWTRGPRVPQPGDVVHVRRDPAFPGSYTVIKATNLDPCWDDQIRSRQVVPCYDPSAHRVVVFGRAEITGVVSS
jgi:hypothetical protein